MHLAQLLQKLVAWFLNKHSSVLETLEEERLDGNGITLYRYRRESPRAYRTWRAVYRSLDYDLIIGWDTLGYIPDVPLEMAKKDKLSTHLVTIYRQGLHARWNPHRGVNEPDIRILLTTEVILEPTIPVQTLWSWRQKTEGHDRPIQTTDDLYARIIDEIAFYALRNPPSQIAPDRIRWAEVIQQTARVFLGKSFQVFPGGELPPARHPSQR